MTNNVIDVEALREAFSYDPDTGGLVWKHRPVHHFKNVDGWKRWNSNWPGKPVGYKQERGYCLACYGYKRLYVHRVVWALHYGYWPVNEIDHINRNKSDNRILNLREATRQENSRNYPLLSVNRSGVCGVGFNKKRRRYRARIYVDRKDIFLGEFLVFEDAVKARKKAELEFNFHSNHGVET